MPLGHELIDARARTDLATAGKRSTREDVAGLRRVDVSLEGLGVVEPLDEVEPAAEVVKRREHATELHRLPLPLRPPFLGMEAVAGEEDGQPRRGACLRGGSARGRGDIVGPHVPRLHPRQRHRDTEATEKRAAGQPVAAGGERIHRGPRFMPAKRRQKNARNTREKRPADAGNYGKTPDTSISRPRISRNCGLATITSTIAPTPLSAIPSSCSRSGSSESWTLRPRA